MTDSSATPVLTGTLPLKPFGDQFYGVIEADGQEAKVAAVACTKEGAIILLSLVGYDISCSAAFATLFLMQEDKSLLFRPKPELGWQGPTRFPHCVGSARHFPAIVLPGTRERQHVALAEQANIHLGLLFPPELPEPEPPKETPPAQRIERFAPTAGKEPQTPPRYVLGNGHEDTPNREAFLGHLRALRVIHARAWADALWVHGLEQGLIAPRPALGVRCWLLSGHLQRWSTFLSQGLAEGWLSDPEPGA